MNSWRTKDIVTAAVLGVACALIFWIWNLIGGSLFDVFNAFAGGFGGLIVGIWLIGGVLGGLIVRRPGAALFVELLAAVISALIGNKWGITTVYSGLAQGLGAELVFAAFRYKRFDLRVAVLAGIGAAVLEWILELFAFGGLAYSVSYNVIYLVTMIISGAVLAGVLGFYLTRALINAGAVTEDIR